MHENRIPLTMRGHITTGLCALLFLIGLGLALAVLARPLYILEIARLDLQQASGLSEAEILQNYDGLIRWSAPWNRSDFSLATLPSSEGAVVHFHKVRHLFRLVWLGGAAGGAVMIPLFSRALRQKEGQRFRVAGKTVLAVPLLIGATALIDFSRAFTLFHEIAFPDDYWWFDYRMDPVILLLPESVFLHRFLLILATVAVGGATLWLLGRRMDL